MPLDDSASSETVCHIETLPTELFRYIFRMLSLSDVLRFGRCSSLFYRIVIDEIFSVMHQILSQNIEIFLRLCVLWGNSLWIEI